MTEYPGPLADVAKVIQLSIAPVFLLTAVGTILGVLSTRLARIVDRARVLIDLLPHSDLKRDEAIRVELKLLVRRRTWVNAAITFGVITALLVCLLIASAFTASMVKLDASRVVTVLFILAMFSFILALMTFLREIVLSS